MARTTIRTEDITASEVTTAKMATDPTNASNLSSGAVPVGQLTTIPGANVTGTIPLAALGNAPATDVTGINDDIALLGFKVASNGSLAKYNLVDQTIDAFEDATGIDGSASTNDNRNASSNYYSGGVTGDATGGTITTYTDSGNDYKVHSFLSGTTNFVTLGPGSVDILLVAGGGGGGGTGGGGGGGGMIVWAGGSVVAGTFAVVVGGGGAGAGYPGNGATGSDTTFDSTTLVAKGGGGGKHSSTGNDGGSGGGSGYNDGTGGADTQSSQSGDSGTYGFGNDGGGGAAHNGYPGGGGGGAGGAGGDPTNGKGGAGGGGKSNDYRTGSNVTYATGAAGGGRNVSSHASGGQAGGTNTGTGGGGGAGGGTVTGYDGGSGIAVIRYIEGSFVAYNDMTLVSNATTAESAPTKGDIVFTYTDGAGTAVVGTDITAEYSADDGSNWTDFGLGTSDAQGTTGGHTIVTKHNVTLTTASGTAMRYRIKTLNQSASKSTNIQAVSLGWS